MAENRIEGRDVYGDNWSAQRVDDDAARMNINTRNGNRWTMCALSVDHAARLGVFALSAAGIDLVGAARKVAEADAKADVLARRLAIDALAAELAKLDAVRT